MKPVNRENAAARDDLGMPAGCRRARGCARAESARRPLRELMDDRLLDALLERSRDQAGGLRLTGEDHHGNYWNSMETC